MAPQFYESAPVTSGLLLLALWLSYSVTSAAILHILRARQKFLVVLSAAICFSVIDTLVPFSFLIPHHALIVSEILFFFGVLRPAKMILFAFDRGPLGRDISLRQHVILAVLPVMPLKCLPENIQKRMMVYKVTTARMLEIAASLVLLLLSCVIRCHLEEANMPTAAGYAAQISAFISFMSQLLNLPAALATAWGCEPIVTPFNEFWKAASVVEWWNYRWNNVVSLTLRLSVYQPIVDAYKAMHPGRSTPGVVAALAGIATFTASGGIHVYAMVAQQLPHAALPLMSFFLLQAVLIAVQPFISNAAMQVLYSVSKPADEKARRHAVDRVLTAVMIISTVRLLWCAAYEPPYSHATHDLAQALLRVAGLCDMAPHCYPL